jgi:hypothetical protein
MARQPKTVHVPYTLERDEDGVWCAHAWLGSSGGANRNGATPQEGAWLSSGAQGDFYTGLGAINVVGPDSTTTSTGHRCGKPGNASPKCLGGSR